MNSISSFSFHHIKGWAYKYCLFKIRRLFVIFISILQIYSDCEGIKPDIEVNETYGDYISDENKTLHIAVGVLEEEIHKWHSKNLGQQ
ncbi:MAG: hypothetical protein LBC89_06175 [Bacteroidales bacterium]|jgi:hypothetical protein|nr:hypothetical protein [Bacteroidales bacterium]